MYLNKTVNIKVRASKKQAKQYEVAAKRAQSKLSQWIRDVLDQAAQSQPTQRGRHD